MVNPLKRMIVREPRSSAIKRIGYNPLTQELFILFNKKGRYPEYVFATVDAEIAEDFMGASSVGQYYHQHIRGNARFKSGKALGSFRLGAFGRRVRNVFRFK